MKQSKIDFSPSLITVENFVNCCCLIQEELELEPSVILSPRLRGTS